MSGREHDEAAELRLSAALAAAREQWPDRDALARVRQGVAAAIGSPMPMSGAGQARLLRRSLRGAWLRGGGTLALLVGAGFTALRLQAGVAPQPAMTVADTNIAPALAGAPALDPATRAQPATVVEAPEPQPVVTAAVTPEPPPPAHRAEPRRKLAKLKLRAPATSAMPVQTAVSADPESELALLRRALASLPHHPKESLDLVAQHERDFAQGIFGQEREVIAIDALLALQQTSAAEARARAFLARYPRSAHAPRIRALLGGDSAPPQMALEHGAR